MSQEKVIEKEKTSHTQQSTIIPEEQTGAVQSTPQTQETLIISQPKTGQQELKPQLQEPQIVNQKTVEVTRPQHQPVPIFTEEKVEETRQQFQRFHTATQETVEVITPQSQQVSIVAKQKAEEMTPQPSEVSIVAEQIIPPTQEVPTVPSQTTPKFQEVSSVLGQTNPQLPVLPERQEYLSEPQETLVTQQSKLQPEKIKSADYSHYNSYIAEDKNQIWAGALTLAWKQLQQSHLNKQSLLISVKQDISQNFSKCQFDKSLIDQKSIFIKSGFGQQTVKEINAGMAQKFPESSFGPLEVNLGPQDLIAYAYLFKKLLFDVQFQRHQYKRLSFTGTVCQQKLVDSFYVQSAKQAKQIQIHRWKGNQDFIVQLKSSSPSDRIYLYKPPRESKLSVGKAIREIVYVQRQNQGIDLEEFRHDIDKFQMPVLDLNYTHSYKELIGARILNNGPLQGYRFSQVAEGLKLKIDEKGVRVQNYGFMIVNECFVSGPNPKTLHFDRPFWIVMKENKSHPYLCIQINNI